MHIVHIICIDYMFIVQKELAPLEPAKDGNFPVFFHITIPQSRKVRQSKNAPLTKNMHNTLLNVL